MSEKWPLRRLAELATKIGSGSTPRGGSESYKATGIPLIRSQNVHFDGLREEGLAFLDAEQARMLDGVTVEPLDVLLNITGASIGRVTVAPPQMAGARVNQHVSIVRAGREIDAEFLAAFLASPDEQARINAEESGATRQALTKGKLEEWEVPVPPLDEQRRIVAKLDALRARSRRAKDALDAVPSLLDRLRQSILAAAFRGDLTADWREQNPNVEPATALLARIRIERRKRWEEAELAKMTAKGRPPKDDAWKSKYVEPEPVDESELSELPEGWCWASLGEVAEIEGGLTKNAGKRTGGRTVPLVTVGAVHLREIRAAGMSTIDLTEEDGERGTLRTGDLLVVEGNGSLDQLGRVALWDGSIPEARHQNHIIRVRAPLLLGHFLLEWLASPFGRSFVEREATSASGLYSLSLSKLARVPVPLAPIAEATAIIHLLRVPIAGVKAVAPSAARLARDLGGLDAAILAAAFRGELTEVFGGPPK